MKKIELLAPAGNMECLYSAIEAGCDAVYLGGKSFGARAFSKNFSNDEIIEAIKYAHIYGVKIYVTVNTLIYDDEVDEFIDYIRFLHKNNVDAVLIQDLGMLDLIRRKFPNLEVHSSTQMHIHNLDGTLLMQKLGVKRVVLARETSIDDIKYIKENSDIELECFIHGALCISYSGECLMSSLIGGRSGNRGCCAGSCRLSYDVINDNGKRINKGDYPISTKELNTIEYIGELIDIGVSSLKIEGRMKSKEYVYKVVKMYRDAIDSYYLNKKIIVNKKDILDLKKIFNRDYTKGFIFNTSNNDLINGYRPNHMGIKVGTIIKNNNNIATIKLIDNISIGSGLRVIGNPDIGILVNEFYINNKLVKNAKSGDIITIKVNDKVKVGSDVLITSDKALIDEIDDLINSKRRRVKIDGKFIADKIMTLELSDGINRASVSSDKVYIANNKPTTIDEIKDKLNKLNNIYSFNNLDISIKDNIFIPLKEINELRRNALELLNEKRLYKSNFIECDYSIKVPDFKKEKLLGILTNKEEKSYDYTYTEELGSGILKLPRVIKKYPDTNRELLVSELGALNKYKDVITDFSLNVVNSYTVAFLHSMGVKRITLSYELTDDQIENLILNYKKRYNCNPNLELIISGYIEAMVSKFSLQKYYNEHVNLRDRFGNMFKVVEKNNLMYIYYYKKLNKEKDKYYDMGINALRINDEI